MFPYCKAARHWSLDRRLAFGSLALYGAAVCFTAFVTRYSLYTTDSWTYYELSKKLSLANFYSFNTLRSYYSIEKSAAFPFGYPALLAVADGIVRSPRAAILVNLLTVGLTCALLVHACRRWMIHPLFGAAAGAGFLLFPGYLDEVLSGRSIPTALLFLGAGFYASTRERSFLGGLLIGLSCLIRFDFLPHSILLLTALMWFRRSGSRGGSIRRWAGFFAAILPWIVYSVIFFGVSWASDNSWVAASALPAHSQDYPARPVISATDDFVLWLHRLINNVPPLLWAIAKSALQAPSLVALVVLSMPKLGSLSKRQRLDLAVFAVLAAASAGPYLLSGYFDTRYFSPLFAVTGLFLARSLSNLSANRDSLFQKVIGALGQMASAGVAVSYLLSASINGLEQTEQEARTNAMIVRLHACHRGEPQVYYVFKDEATVLAYRYGAITGDKVAAIPLNFDRIKPASRVEFFRSVAPYRLIERLPRDLPCS